MVRMVSKPSLEALKVSLPPLEQQRNIAQFFNLFVREQNLLKELRKNKARRIQETLMQVALGSYQKANNKKTWSDFSISNQEQTKQRS